MLGNVLTRRAALLGFGAFASAGLSGCNTTPVAGVQPAAAPAPGLGGGAIDVDTSPLVAYVGNPTAGWVQQSLPGALARVLGSGAPGGLRVRVDTLYLGNGGPADPDRMRGVATLGGRTINVRATSTYWPSPTDQALPEQALQGRVQALSVAFAYRLKRKLGA
ncbi:MAG TPA: hypothetical protein VGG77_11185 [Roseiarcus sp.]|jgi:hypothetical protein